MIRGTKSDQKVKGPPKSRSRVMPKIDKFLHLDSVERRLNYHDCIRLFNIRIILIEFLIAVHRSIITGSATARHAAVSMATSQVKMKRRILTVLYNRNLSIDR